MTRTTDPTHLLVLLVGGSMLLLHGVKQVTNAMQQAFGARLQLIMMSLATRPFAAFGSGVAVTLLTQSSTATASIMIGLVNAQVVPLATAIVLLLGAGVGSTLVVQLLAFHFTDYALEFLGLAGGVALLTQRTRFRDVGRGLFSFGFILVGLAMIDASSTPIADSAITNAILRSLAQSPLVLLLLGMALATVFVSSIAAIGIVMVLASGGALPISAALAVTLGANVGTTLTPLLSSLNQVNVAGRRLGIIYTGTRLVGAVGAMLCLDGIASLLNQFVPNPAAQIALAHLGFNLILAAIFVPLAGRLATFVTRTLPEPERTRKQGSHYLDPNALTVPGVALGQAMREVLRMADLAMEMLQLGIRAFEDGAKDVSKQIGNLDDQLDALETAVKNYLIQLDSQALNEEQAHRELFLLHISTELEAIGDIVDRQLMRLARRKHRKQIAFTPSEWADLVAYHREVLGLLQQVLAGLATQDSGIANDVLIYRHHLNQIKRDLQLRQLQSLTSSTPTNLDASAIHLEMVSAMSRILSHTCSIARAVQGDL